MIRVEIPGTYNSCAVIYSRLVNLPGLVSGKMFFQDMRATRIRSRDRRQAEKIAKETGIDATEEFKSGKEVSMV